MKMRKYERALSNTIHMEPEARAKVVAAEANITEARAKALVARAEEQRSQAKEAE